MSLRWYRWGRWSSRSHAFGKKNLFYIIFSFTYWLNLVNIWLREEESGLEIKRVRVAIKQTSRIRGFVYLTVSNLSSRFCLFLLYFKAFRVIIFVVLGFGNRHDKKYWSSQPVLGSQLQETSQTKGEREKVVLSSLSASFYALFNFLRPKIQSSLNFAAFWSNIFARFLSITFKLGKFPHFKALFLSVSMNIP